MLFNVGKEQLLGKQLLLSAWELITDPPLPMQSASATKCYTETGTGEGRGRKESKKQG